VWVPLVVAVFGLAGVLVTQSLATRREDARWERERARERDRWAREDTARSYDHRRDAYMAFFKTYNERWNALETAWISSGVVNEPPEDFLAALYDLASEVEIFGTREAASCAREAYKALSAHAFANKRMPDEPLHLFQEQVRLDLGIPD
jgi:hypothetical protein